ncbi:hypothetical protein VAMP_106108n29 [Candidatus Vampirococcus lugosii]|uniref:Prepilin-type N-terminal cleavage/methylation domain-containing protein n=2 Tax=Candidatus Vampirococcus lugosii TaxID=2789015 RepID=A0ABS5QMN5_9BACT|nr:hypothetical protein [Candidatus Vampirococcus lugosii]
MSYIYTYIYKNMIFSNKKAFTLIELIITTIIISTGVLGIVSVIDYGFKAISIIRQDVIATNLAREGIEGVFNIRDTNWFRWSGRRDQCWLLEDPLGASSDCQSEDWIGSGNYILSGTTQSGQLYNYLSGSSSTLNLDDGYNVSQDGEFALCSETGKTWHPCPGQDNTSPEGRFFRMIQVKGLYNKEDGSTLNSCSNGNDTTPNDCGDETAKELVFCSIVEYTGNGGGKVELCSSITNFKD